MADDYEAPRFSFSEALGALKRGKRVRRTGWNGKGMWLFLVGEDDYALSARFGIHSRNKLPWIGMKTADNKVVPWLASQTDILAEDWQVLDVDE